MFNVRTTFGKMANAFSVPMSWFRKVGAYLIHFTIEVRGGEDKGITAFVRKPDNPSEQEPPTIVLDVTGLHIGSGGAELGDAAPLVDSGTGAIGTSTKASREDHAHPLNAEPANLSGIEYTSPPLSNGNTGVSTKYARSDHHHPMGIPGPSGGNRPYVPNPDSQYGDAGDDAAYARFDHVHPFSDTLNALMLWSDAATAVINENARLIAVNQSDILIIAATTDRNFDTLFGYFTNLQERLNAMAVTINSHTSSISTLNGNITTLNNNINNVNSTMMANFNTLWPMYQRWRGGWFG